MPARGEDARTSLQEEDMLRAYLRKRGNAEKLIEGAVSQLREACKLAGRKLTDCNREVFRLLYYGATVNPGAHLSQSFTAQSF